MRRIVLDTSVLLQGAAFSSSDSGKLLSECKKGEFKVILSDRIIDEARTALSRKNPLLLGQLDLLVKEIAPEMVAPDSELVRVAEQILDPGDAYVAATAIQGGVNNVCTLDKDFYRPASRRLLESHSIYPCFPCNLIWNIPRGCASTVLSGTVLMIVEPSWSSTLDLQDKRFYFLDLENVFGFYYQFPQRRFRFEPYPLSPEFRTSFKREVLPGSVFFLAVAYDYQKGFYLLLDDDNSDIERNIRRKWSPPAEPCRLWLGSSSKGSDQINGILSFQCYPSFLSPKTIRTMARFKTLSLSDHELELAEALGPLWEAPEG